MKVVTVAILILILFCTGAVFINIKTVKDSEKLLNNINKLEKNIEENNWDNTQATMNELKDKWLNTKQFWELFLEHYEIDNIDVVIAAIDSYCKTKETSLSLGEIAKLKHLLDHIAEKDKLKISNIF